MMNNLPLRLTILHFAQRLRMEGLTFMISFSLLTGITAKRRIIVGLLVSVQFRCYLVGSRDSQNERVAFCYGHRMLLVGC